MKRLERLMRKRTDPRDGRRALLSLSKKGRRFDVEAEGTTEAAIQRALNRAPSDQMEAARALLAFIAETLNNLDAPMVENRGWNGAPYG